MAGTSERAKKLKESRERAKEISKTKDKAPFSPKDNVKASPGSKSRADKKTTPGTTKFNEALTPKKVSPGSKVRKESRDAKTTTVVKKTTVTADPAKKTPKKSAPKGQAEKGANPLAGKPRSIAEAKKRGELYFFDSKGVKKIAATAADLKRTGLTLRQYANKFAPKKQTKAHAKALTPYAASKKRAGGMMKKKGMARGGMMMKKKGMAKGGKLKMVMKDGKKVPFFAADGKGKMRGGGMMKKKGYAMGGAMKKKGYKKGGKVLKMRGGGLATRGTSFTIK